MPGDTATRPNIFAGLADIPIDPLTAWKRIDSGVAEPHAAADLTADASPAMSLEERIAAEIAADDERAWRAYAASCTDRVCYSAGSAALSVHPIGDEASPMRDTAPAASPAVPTPGSPESPVVAVPRRTNDGREAIDHGTILFVGDQTFRIVDAPPAPQPVYDAYPTWAPVSWKATVGRALVRALLRI